MTITRNFKLCLNAGTQNAPYINVNQYDEGEQWIFDLYTEGGQKFTPSTGAIIGIKSDGNAILNSGTVNSDGQVVITETQQMTAASGLAVFELLIEGETHGTANFIVNVERRPSDDAEFSDSDISMLQEAIDAAEVINEILDEGGDPSEIIEENVNAWLDNHPEATTTVQDGAITAPKINNSLWDKILVNEEASGNPASFDDGADDVPVSSLKVALEPVQLGSGDPSPSNVRPIIASNGKNVLPLTVASCQTNSTAGTWNDNVYTHLGITYTLNTGADGTVESVTMNGTSTGASELRIALVSFDPTKTYKVNGIVGGSTTSYRFNIGGVGTYYDNDYSVTFEDTTAHICRLQVPNGVAVSNATVQPMIRLDGTDATFQPYQGITVERTGKNLIYPKYAGRTNNGITYTVNADGTITTSGTATGSSYAAPNLANLPELMQIVPEGTYTLTGGISANEIVYLGGKYIDESSLPPTYDRGSGVTFTLTKPAYLYPQIQITNGTSSNRTFYIQLERGSEASDFEPYTFTSYPVSLGREVYGGSVDLATGVLTVDRAYALLNDPTTWSASSGSTTTYNCSVWFADRKKYSDSYTGLMCSYLVVDPTSQGMTARWTGSTSNVFGLKIDSITLDDVKQAASDGKIAICYPLATQQTHQLTPTQVNTLLGYNNISSTGTVDVIYHADTKLYIDKKIGELS